MGVYKHKNGKWYCRGRVKQYRYHKCCKTTDKSEAKEFEDDLRQQLRQKTRGVVTSKRDYTFVFMMELYVNVYKANNNSVRLAETYSKYLVKYFGEDTNVLNVRPSDIEKFKNYMLSENKKKSTINRYLSAIKRAYNLMNRDELIDYNPTKYVSKFKEDNKRHIYLTREEWNELKDVLPKYLLDIIMVALYTGLRKSNVLNLRWEYINLNDRTIIIPAENSKGKKEIVIPITNKLYELLLELEPQDEGYVFVNQDTGLPYKDLRKAMETCLKEVGIDDFHFHDLRRTFGTWLLEEGVDIRTIQSLLGHADISTTERYLSISKDRNMLAINKLENII